MENAEKCPECDRDTQGLGGEPKWCCYCGARLTGLSVASQPTSAQPAANVEHRPLQPACPDELDKDVIDFKWREINRADDSWTPSPHVVLAQWAYGKGLHAAQPSVPDGWQPTPENINAQPDPAMEGDEISDEELSMLFWMWGWKTKVGRELRFSHFKEMARVLLNRQRVQPASGEDAKDAERYRAIRAAAVADDHSFLDQLEDYAEKCFPDGHPPVEADLDACIDAVIQQRAGK